MTATGVLAAVLGYSFGVVGGLCIAEGKFEGSVGYGLALAAVLAVFAVLFGWALGKTAPARVERVREMMGR